jgi:hypothetical protein
VGVCWSALALFAASSCYHAQIDLSDLMDEVPGGTSPSMAGTGGSASGTNVGGSSMAGSGEPLGMTLGRACNKNSECGPLLVCVAANDEFDGTVGAPPGGMCTKPCATDAECRVFDDLAVCGSVSEIPLTNLVPPEQPIPRVCLLGCALGSHGGIAKCQGRSDLACRPFAGPDSVQCGEDKTCPAGSFCFRDHCRELACGPRCNDDSDCSARFCDPVSGLCIEAKPDAVPLGQECSDLPTSPDCGGGNCLVLFDDGVRVKGMCTQSCTLGQTCGEGEGACITPRFSDYGVGDIAYCQPLCDCDADCRNPVDGCIEWSDPAFAAKFGSRGTCDVAPAGSTTLDCMGGAGGATSEGGAGGAASEGGAGGATSEAGAAGARAGD